MAAYLIRTGKSAPMLDQKAVELRNRVIHHGYIPGRQEAIRYGQAVADCAYPLLHLLGNSDFEPIIVELTFDLLKVRGRSARDVGCRTSTMALNTVLEVTRDAAPVSIEAAVNERAKHPNQSDMVAQTKQFGRYMDPKGPEL